MKSRLAAALTLALPVLMACSGSSGGHPATESSSPSSTSPAAHTPTDELVVTFRGSADLATKSFSVRKGWELRYEITGGRLTVDLLDSSGAKVSQLVNQRSAGGGSVYPSQTGTYSLKITTTGKFLVRVFNH